MGNRLYTIAVVSLWGASMAWLVSERILPPFFRGEPPSTGLFRQYEPAAWRIEMDGQPCGHAVLQSVAAERGVTEVHSRLLLQELRTPKGLPPWLLPLTSSLDQISIDMHTIAIFDSFGKLYSFETTLELSDLRMPVRLKGRVDEGFLCLAARIGDLETKKEFKHPWPADGLLADELLPEAKLISVYPGRRWQKEVYSPFASPNQPVEMIEAVVLDEMRRIQFEGESYDTRVIEYRSADRSGVSQSDRLRSTLLVAEDGRVLRQQAKLLGSELTFDRVGQSESNDLAEELLDLQRFAATYLPETASRASAETSQP